MTAPNYGFGPRGPNAATVRPMGTQADPYARQTWFKNASAPGARDGTPIDAEWLNTLIAERLQLALASGVQIRSNAPADRFLVDAIQALVRSRVSAAINGQQIGDMLDAQYGETWRTTPTGAQMIEAIDLALGGISWRSVNQATIDAAVASAINALKGSVGTALDTLEELADALNNDPNLSATLTTAITNEVTRATAAEGALSALVAALNTLSGVAASATHLGTFTGSTIADNVSIKAALQALETAVEAAAASTGATMAAGSVKGNTGGVAAIPADIPFATLKASLNIVMGDVSGLVSALAAKAPLASPDFSGTPQASGNAILHLGNFSTWVPGKALGNTYSNHNVFTNTGAVAVASVGGTGGLEAMATGAGAAFMTFHRPGNYAGVLGLDTDNKLKWGGWSVGAVAYEIVHAGNYTSYLGSAATISVSSEITVAAAGTATTWTHGLGAIPKAWGVKLRCKTAEAGYSVEDEVELGTYVAADTSTNVVSRSIWATSTVVGTIVAAAGGLVIPSKSNGTVLGITAGNWRYVFYAIK